MTNHTPGPWRIEPHHGSGSARNRVTSYVIYSDSDVDAEGREISPEDPIGEIYGGWDEKEMHANATLIAQAWTIPALRAALEASNQELITQRAELRDRITGIHGSIVVDPANVAGVAEMAKMDALIDTNRTALADGE